MNKKIIKRLIIDENSDLKSDTLNIQQKFYINEPYSEIKSNEDLLDLNFQLFNIERDNLSPMNSSNDNMENVESYLIDLNDSNSKNTIIQGGCVKGIFDDTDLEKAKPVLSEIIKTWNIPEVNLSGVNFEIIDSE